MKLTGNLLLAELEQETQVLFRRGIAGCTGLEGPLICRAEDIPQQGWVYVAEEIPPSAPEINAPNLLFVLVGEKETALPEDCGVIRVGGGAGAEEVLNLLTRCYARYERWVEGLEEIQYRFGSVEEMLEYSLPIFQNPLMVMDSDLSVLHWVCDGVSSKEGLDFFGGGKARMEIITSILQDPEYQFHRSRTECYWGPEYHLGFRCACWNVLRNEDTQYCLSVVEEERRLTEADMDLLKLLGFHVKFALYHQEWGGAGRMESLGKILRRILTDRTLDYLEASRMLSELGWEKDHSYLCLVYQLTYLDRSALPTVSICRYMEEQYACSSFLHEERIVTFFNLTRCGMDQERIQNQLKPFIRDSYLKAGFSRTVVGHMHLRHQYVQAFAALDVGSRRHPYQWIHYFDQLALIYIQEQVTRRLPRDLLIHPGLLRLREKDREQGTEYIKTLRVYLDESRNAVRSAKALYIHRSTFLYRMEKIREILESDLSDSEENLYLSLSLRLMELG